ncbi:hypothetical protein PR048_025093 [Dryococelus australis]|uniref:Uncharacterized protein n=1 Tax=Dryococelus australis TaxID=614101 RepID=A0ABQ9GQE1_9NEOP|nr:hypothetical protein PR048_025093 [Dryococelus australis]
MGKQQNTGTYIIAGNIRKHLITWYLVHQVRHALCVTGTRVLAVSGTRTRPNGYPGIFATGTLVLDYPGLAWGQSVCSMSLFKSSVQTVRHRRVGHTGGAALKHVATYMCKGFRRNELISRVKWCGIHRRFDGAPQSEVRWRDVRAPSRRNHIASLASKGTSSKYSGNTSCRNCRYVAPPRLRPLRYCEVLSGTQTCAQAYYNATYTSLHTSSCTLPLPVAVYGPAYPDLLIAFEAEKYASDKDFPYQGEPGSIPGGVAFLISARGNRARRCRCSASFLESTPPPPPVQQSEKDVSNDVGGYKETTTLRASVCPEDSYVVLIEWRAPRFRKVAPPPPPDSQLELPAGQSCGVGPGSQPRSNGERRAGGHGESETSRQHLLRCGSDQRVAYFAVQARRRNASCFNPLAASVAAALWPNKVQHLHIIFFSAFDACTAAPQHVADHIIEDGGVFLMLHETWPKVLLFSGIHRSVIHHGTVLHDPHLRKPGMSRPGIEPGSPWWEAISQTTQPPWSRDKSEDWSGQGKRVNSTKAGLENSCCGNIHHSLGGYGDVVVRLLASHLGKLGYIPGRVTPGFSYVGTALDDSAGGRVFSGSSRFPRSYIPALLHTHLVYPRDLDVKRRPNLYTPTTHSILIVVKLCMLYGREVYCPGFLIYFQNGRQSLRSPILAPRMRDANSRLCSHRSHTPTERDRFGIAAPNLSSTFQIQLHHSIAKGSKDMLRRVRTVKASEEAEVTVNGLYEQCRTVIRMGGSHLENRYFKWFYRKQLTYMKWKNHYGDNIDFNQDLKPTNSCGVLSSPCSEEIEGGTARSPLDQSKRCWWHILRRLQSELPAHKYLRSTGMRRVSQTPERLLDEIQLASRRTTARSLFTDDADQFNLGTRRLVLRSQRDRSTSSLVYGSGYSQRTELVVQCPGHVSELVAGAAALQLQVAIVICGVPALAAVGHRRGPAHVRPGLPTVVRQYAPLRLQQRRDPPAYHIRAAGCSNYGQPTQPLCVHRDWLFAL